MDDINRLIKGMDLHQPDWWLRFAEPNDLIDLARGTCGRETVRTRVAERLMMPVRAAIEVELVTSPKVKS